MAIRWAQTQAAAIYKFAKLPTDIWSMQMRRIMHHASILSYLHHNTEGAAISYIPISSMKSWVGINPKVACNKMRGILDSLICGDAILSAHSD